MPTKTSPWARRVGPIAAQISRSRRVSSVFSGRPPTCRLARASPAAGHPQDPAHGLAFDQDDALVARPDLRQVALHHDRLALDLLVHLQKRGQVLVPRTQPEYAGPAIAEQRLQDDVAVLVPEGADLVAVAGQEGRRHQLPEAQHKELLRRVAHRRRIVDHERPVRRQQLEQMGRGDIGHVERRVLAHQDHVDAGEVELLRGAEAVMMAVAADHLERPPAGIEAPVAQAQRLGQVVEQRMAAGLRLEREGEGRIRIDVDRVDRIHLDRDGETHGSSPGDRH